MEGAPLVAPPQQQMEHGSPLEPLAGVFVKQQFEFMELCGCEIPNRYKVYPLGPDGKSAVNEVPILYMKERMNGFCDCLYKQFCGPCRASITDIFLGAQPGGSSLGEFQKSCGIAYCVACFGSGSTLVPAGSATHVSVVDESNCLCFPCMGAKMRVMEYKIDGGCMYKGFCPCCDYPMKIRDPTGTQVGSLGKVAGGCAEFCTGTNRYAVVFPKDATPDKKLALLSAALHLDLNFFEQKKGDN